MRYRFSIQGENNFQQQGKLLIVFPKQYTFTSANQIVCTNIDDGNKRLDCAFNSFSARLMVLKINSTSFVQQRTFQFSVSGINNPEYASETDPFIIQNYYLDSNNVYQYEPSSDKIKVTPKPGTLTQCKLVLSFKLSP